MKILFKIIALSFLLLSNSYADLIKPNSKLKPFDVIKILLSALKNNNEPYHFKFVHNTTTKQHLKHHYTIVDGICLGSGVDVK